MDVNTKQAIKGRVSVLPEKLQERLLIYPWRGTLKGIAAKYNLDNERAESLKTEVFLILAGMEPVNGFRANLVQGLGITYDQALKISYDINTSIFNPVMEILKEIEEQIKKVDVEEEKEIFTNSDNESAKNTPVTQIKQEEQEKNQTSPDTNPDDLIPTHEEMLKKEGPHLHSQTIMPAPATTGAISSATTGSSYRKPEPPPQTARPFKSIVDQKLAGIVRSSSEPSHPANSPADTKNPPPQNPTGAPTSVSSSDNGYKGNDPYREPIE